MSFTPQQQRVVKHATTTEGGSLAQPSADEEQASADGTTARIGSLFSGIGGLELGLERAGLGCTVWQVEKDAFCRAVLAKHWPQTLRLEDVSEVGRHNLAAVDIICGGFPCQDVSSAGKRTGLAGARSGLWFEYLRIVTEMQPSWVVVENVASGARAWVDVVVNGLERQGYSCLPIPIAAADVGAPHKRERIFIVAAHVDAKSEPVGTEHAEMASASEAAAESTHAGWSVTQPSMVRMVHGLSRGLDKPSNRIKALGNAVVPQCAEVIGHVIRLLQGAA